MKRLRRVNGTPRVMMAIPETATEQKRNVVMPPMTELGMATRAAANLAKTPMMMRNMLNDKQLSANSLLVVVTCTHIYTHTHTQREGERERGREREREREREIEKEKEREREREREREDTDRERKR